MPEVLKFANITIHSCPNVTERHLLWYVTQAVCPFCGANLLSEGEHCPPEAGSVKGENR